MPINKLLIKRVKSQVSHGSSKLGIPLFLMVLIFSGILAYLYTQTKVEGTLIQSHQADLLVPEEVFAPVVPEKEIAIASPSPSFPAIPFYLQAPGGAWADPIFQNACEEVSILMVADALAITTRTEAEQKKKLKEIAVWQQQVFGTSVDTNVTDTARTLEEYLQVRSKVVKEITAEKMKALLAENTVVLVPTNGQKLKNPHFQAPGPVTHMLVVFGYDETKKQFIVHDPGTRLGEKYRYDAEILVAAIGEYPTGNHKKVTEPLPKTGLVISQ